MKKDLAKAQNSISETNKTITGGLMYRNVNKEDAKEIRSDAERIGEEQHLLVNIFEKRTP